MPGKSRKDRTITLEDVRLIFRNFKGREGPFNAEGQRNFCVILDDKTASAMSRDGWNVKVLSAKEGEEEDLPETPYLPVAVNFRNRPPRIVMITSRGRSFLSEELCEQLDYADIIHCDVIINPYEWGDATKGGIKAYLDAIYVTIEEDELEKKYGHLPIAGVARQEDADV